MLLRRRLGPLTAVGLIAACSGHPVAARSDDAGPSDAGVACGAETCASGQLCCAMSLTCYAATCTTCCGSPPDAGATCMQDSDCSGAEYCAGSGCSAPGTCTTRPATCPSTVDLVCGCDGQTYTNSCDAEADGVRVASSGPCTAGDGGVIDGGPVDGGVCTDDTECATEDYCGGTGCGTPGTCEQRPTMCPGIVDVACGCDGRTYDNVCDAFASGTRLRIAGPCQTGIPDAGPADDGGEITCTSNGDCPASDWCSGTGCIGRGICETRPRECPPPSHPPVSVCGCNGTTYDAVCYAQMAGERVSFQGACAGSHDGG